MNQHRLRLSDYLMHMADAARDACGYGAGLSMDEFLQDKRTQQAVVMNLIIIGEAASRIMDNDPTFVQAHPEVPWRAMRGMRNRIAHGYFDINLDVVWNTLSSALPDLLTQLSHLSTESLPEASAGTDGHLGQQ